MKFAYTLSALAASTAVTALAIPVENAPKLYTIELSPTDTRQVTEEEKWALLFEGKHFIDVTDYDYPPAARVKTARVAFPSEVKHQAAVEPLLSKLQSTGMKTHLQKLVTYNNRYYKATSGRDAADWLTTAVQAVVDGASTNSTRAAATVKPYTHSGWAQKSIIATIPGKSANTIVVGSHLDSVASQFSPSTARAPGADDNGSGSVTILEVLRVLLSDPKIASGQAPNTIEFHWYAAEEAGLLGSQAIFADYKRQGRVVKAMLNQDMTGYSAGSKANGGKDSMGVITDNVDSSLTAFIKKVITAYCDIPGVDTKCGYACSDHASAQRNGYPSAFVIEAAMEKTSKSIHTGQDTIEKLDFNHMLEHAKMSLGFLYELGFTASL